MMKLGLIAALLLTPAFAMAQPVEGPVSGTVDIDPDETVIQPIDLLGGEPTLFVIRGEGGQIDCGLFTTDGKAIVMDQDPNRNSCVFSITPEETDTVVLAVKNRGTEVSTVSAVAK